ncbi:hypothetical protein GU926_16990 [Nibribacter ruber]|uniref:Uncharacterized protein n=1 Tax=Nibribacter ruber TaxID=2698458 RepID=A0A6P1P3M2_9BACT|nr:hypothetical protein [Nibribacter ruber]QHL89029.1 hypothetical protein GU926_16990 [Nibribacter ruber]
MKRFFTSLSLAASVGLMLSFSSPSAAPKAVSAYNPQCTATAKSTGKQCKNKQWGKCEQVLCYVHCQ